MGEKYVPDGVYLLCNKGATPCGFHVSENSSAFLYGQKSGSAGDNKFGINVTGFGACAILKGPCAPAMLNWQNTATGITTGMNPLLMDSSKLLCNFGGMIEIKFSLPDMFKVLEHWQGKAFDSIEAMEAHLPQPLKGYFQFQTGIAEGILVGAESLVEGLWSLGKMGFHAVTHPIETAESIAKGVGKVAEWAEKNPGDAALLAISPEVFIGKKLYDNRAAISEMGGKMVDAMKNGSPRDWGRWAGRAAFEIGSFFVGAGEAGALAKGAEVASAAEKVAEAGNLAAKGAEVLVDAEKLANETKTIGAVLREGEAAAEAARLEKAAQEAKALEGVNCSNKCVKDPVDPITGHVLYPYTDIELPGPIPLKWEREYNSGSRFEGILGKGISSSYDLQLIENTQRETIEIIQKNGTAVAVHMAEDQQTSYHSVAQIEIYRHENSFRVFYYKTRLYYTYELSSSGKHRVIAVEDEKGFAIEFKYNGSKLTRIIDSRKKIIDVTTNAKGYITQLLLINPVGNKLLVTYEYNESGDMIAIGDSLRQKTKIEYDDNHRMIKKTDRNGQSFYWKYDSEGRCFHTWGDDGLQEGFFQYQKKYTVLTDPTGLKEIYHYNDNYQPTQLTDVFGNSKFYNYNEKGQLIEETDEEGLSTRYNFDASGNLIQTLFPDGSMQSFVFDKKNRPILSTDPSGNNTQWIYAEDKLFYIERLHKKNYLEYNEYNLLSRIKNEKGEKTTLNYDEQYNLTEMILPDGRTTQWKYNSFSECVEVINPLGKKQRFEYDRLGRLAEIKLPNTEIIDLKYDAYDNVIQANSLHHKVKFSYTPLGSVKSREENGIKVTFDYDKQERLRALSNEKGDRYTFIRNERGDITQEISFDGITKYYNRDKAGKVVKIKRPGGKSTEYEYDKGGRIVRAQYHDGSWEAFTYNKGGQLIEARNQLTEVLFVRNSLGKILEERQGEHKLTYQYDEKGNLVSLKSSLGADVKYSRDKNGWVDAIEAKHHKTTEAWTANIRRNMLGLEIERDLPGGVKSSWSYDDNNNPLTQQVNQNGLRTGLHKKYSWNANEQLQKITNILTNGTTHYEYDLMSNLAWSQYEDGSYDYKLPDEIGNLYKSKAKDDKKYGAGGKLLKDKNWNYLYDDEGNLVRKSVFAVLNMPKQNSEPEHPKFRFLLDDDKQEVANAKQSEQQEILLSNVETKSNNIETRGDWTYKWDANGMLQQVTNPQGKVVRFEYDALGRRIAKIVEEKINRYVWDGNVLLHEWKYAIQERPKLEVNPEGKLIYNKSEPVATDLITWIYEDTSFVPSSKLINDEKYSIIADYIGRPIQAYSETGELVWETDYDIYGKLRNLKGLEAFIPFRQLGQYEDEELDGLYYNRFRYYDSDTGGYISQDPIGLEGNNPNFYAYLHDSNSFIDILGLIECPLKTKNLNREGELIESKVSKKGAIKEDLIFSNKNEAKNWASRMLGPSKTRIYDDSGKWIGWENKLGDKAYWGHNDWGKGVGSSTFPHLNYNISGKQGHAFLRDKIINRNQWDGFTGHFGL
jgi:RHS repeat-associated protein